MSSPVSAVRRIAHNIMNSFLPSGRATSMKERRAKVLYLLVKYCVHLFFFSSFNCAAVAFFVLWCVSASFETCWLDFWRRRCLLRKIFFSALRLPKVQYMLTEWMAVQSTKPYCVRCFTFIFFLNLYSHLFIQLLLATFQTFHFLLYHFAQGGTALFYGTQFRFMLASSFRKVHTTSVAA